MQTLQQHVLAAILMTSSLSTWALATDDTGTVGQSGWELETTLEFAQDKDSGQTIKERALGISVNYGLNDAVDIGFALVHAHADDGTTQVNGLSDTEVSLKWRFYDQDGLSFALSPAVTLPTGNEDKGLGTGKASFGANLILSKALENEWSLHANAGWSHINFKDQALADASNRNLWNISLAVNKQVNDQWGVGGELGMSRIAVKGVDENPAFGGVEVVYTPREKMEFSIGYSFAINDVETDSILGLSANFNW